MAVAVGVFFSWRFLQQQMQSTMQSTRRQQPAIGSAITRMRVTPTRPAAAPRTPHVSLHSSLASASVQSHATVGGAVGGPTTVDEPAQQIGQLSTSD